MSTPTGAGYFQRAIANSFICMQPLKIRSPCLHVEDREEFSHGDTAICMYMFLIQFHRSSLHVFIEADAHFQFFLVWSKLHALLVEPRCVFTRGSSNDRYISDLYLPFE